MEILGVKCMPQPSKPFLTLYRADFRRMWRGKWFIFSCPRLWLRFKEWNKTAAREGFRKMRKEKDIFFFLRKLVLPLLHQPWTAVHKTPFPDWSGTTAPLIGPGNAWQSLVAGLCLCVVAAFGGCIVKLHCKDATRSTVFVSVLVLSIASLFRKHMIILICRIGE